jgi:ubiquinone/menaquinone biosynthesis C-methylase UbiE
MKKEQLVKKFNRQAEKYDRQRDKQSKSNWRKKIFSSVRGRTLEVAVGAGMNYAFFPSTIDYTGVDFSPAMLEKAKEAANRYRFKSEFIHSDVENLSFQDSSFDTIISSGTLCSYDNPVEVLNLFNKWCRKDGQILLLEHGLFDTPPLSWLQKRLDPLVYKFLGCHQNRDIQNIINESQLEVVKYEREFLGYLNSIWARPQK